VQSGALGEFSRKYTLSLASHGVHAATFEAVSAKREQERQQILSSRGVHAGMVMDTLA
jgi:hypothetical protein